MHYGKDLISSLRWHSQATCKYLIQNKNTKLIKMVELWETWDKDMYKIKPFKVLKGLFHNFSQMWNKRILYVSAISNQTSLKLNKIAAMTKWSTYPFAPLYLHLYNFFFFFFFTLGWVKYLYMCSVFPYYIASAHDLRAHHTCRIS